MTGPTASVQCVKATGVGIFAWLLCGSILASAVPAVAAAASATGGEIVPGKGVGPVILGMAAGDLLQRWGLPERTERDVDGVVLYDYGTAKGVGVFVSGDRVSQILVVGREWSTPSGIGVGATRPEVVAFYGRPDEFLQGQSLDEFRYWYKHRGLVFIFRDRAVAGITVLPAEAEAPPGGLRPDDPVLRKPFLPTPR